MKYVLDEDEMQTIRHALDTAKKLAEHHEAYKVRDTEPHLLEVRTLDLAERALRVVQS